IVAFGFVALPQAKPFDVSNIEALPVELVTLAEITDLTEGARDSEIPPLEVPQPRAEQEAPVEAPVEAEKPAEKIVEVAKEPEPQPEPEPEPEPIPEPEPEPDQVAALIEEPEPKPAVSEPEPTPEPEPVVEKKAPAPTPRLRPEPPKRVNLPKPPVVKKPDKEEAEFKLDDIAALLNKQEPAGGGDPEPATTPQTFGSDAGTDSSAMTQSEVEALKARLYQCWNPPRGVREAGSLRVTIGISLQPDGRLAAAPQVISSGFDPLSKLAAESAIRAVQICAPYDILPRDKYQSWREIEFVFDPREMLGG
ncbi:MAG: cell envelope biogenesis protein TolA, partial [Alphaproteobacteria bacterium]